MAEQSLKGSLLIAAPALLDPNFRRTVILVAEHGEEGAMGVILNRPSETAVAEAVPELAPLAGDADPVFVGGPVAADSLLALAEVEARHALADRGVEGELANFEPVLVR